MSEQPIIQVKNVSKTFHTKVEVKALINVSHEVKKGEVVVICGPSGSGKSTLLRCLNRLEIIDSGEIIIDGIPVHDRKTNINKLRAEVGMVFQSFNLFPHLTVQNNVCLAQNVVRKRKSAVCTEKASQLLEKVGISEKANVYPAQLSGGQQQRVAIARSLAMNPDIMLFDEVTAALDPETVKEVLVTIRDLADEGMTCLIVTHEMGFAKEVADHMYFTDNGVIVEQGPPEEFFTSAKDPRTREFLSQIL